MDISCKLTVILTTYNTKKYVGQAIKSVLNQTYKDYKFIILDNCSTDNTEGVVSTFKDSRITYIRNEKNIGFVGNINKALSLCDTEYLIIVHDDDVLKPQLFEKEINILENYEDVSIVGSNRTYINDQGYMLYNLYSFKKDRICKKHEYIKSGLTLCLPTIMYRMSFIKKHNLKYLEYVSRTADTYFQYELNMLDTCIYFIGEPLIYYRRHSDQLSKDVLPVLLDRLNFCEKVYLLAKKEKLDWLIRQNYSFLTNLLFGRFYSFDYDDSPLYEAIINLKQKEIYNTLTEEHKLLINIFMRINNKDMKLDINSSNEKNRLQLLNRWYEKISNNDYISNTLNELNVNNIAVYGKGIYLYFFIKDCVVNDIDIKYILTKQSKYIAISEYNIPVFNNDGVSVLPSNIDALIVLDEKATVNVSEYDNICNNIIYLEELL
ncbi:MAG: glycosyltransferase [Vallitalea sp.]|nr:glycosyltransferase [Vallitalea sp.]